MTRDRVSLYLLLCFGALTAGLFAKAILTDPFELLAEMAKKIDLDAASGALKHQDKAYSDPAGTHSQLQIWREGSGLARKLRVEHSAGGQMLSVDDYYDPSGRLRYMVHASARSLPPEEPGSGAPVQEVFQQSLAFDEGGKLLKVLYSRSWVRQGETEEQVQNGELPWPDESLWPVHFAWDPEADFEGSSAGPVPKKKTVVARAQPSSSLRPAELAKWLDSGKPLQLVDVRGTAEFAEGSLKGAKLIPLPELDARWRELDPGKKVVLICRSGKRSAVALKLLKGKGFKDVSHLSGGLLAWQASGQKIQR